MGVPRQPFHSFVVAVAGVATMLALLVLASSAHAEALDETAAAAAQVVEAPVAAEPAPASPEADAEAPASEPAQAAAPAPEAAAVPAVEAVTGPGEETARAAAGAAPQTSARPTFAPEAESPEANSSAAGGSSRPRMSAAYPGSRRSWLHRLRGVRPNAT